MDRVEKIVKHIAYYPTKLKDLSVDKLETVGRAIKFDELKGEMKHKVGLCRINYLKEKEIWLGRYESKHTINVYHKGLLEMEEYVNKIGLKNPLELNYKQADDFVIGICKNRAPNSVRSVVAGCSSFFTWLSRRYEVINNPFRGCSERPHKKNVRPLELPTEQEIDKVIKYSSNKVLGVALMVLKNCGVRIGSLPNMTIRDGKYSAYSKGKIVIGEVSKEIVDKMKQLKLNLNKPFSMYEDKKMKNAMQYNITRLYNKGKIKINFSPHDLRRCYAIKKYNESKDIMLVKKLLNHASVNVTETYLKESGVTT